jgi:hypothetical protein
MSVPEISTLLPVLTARRSVELNAAASSADTTVAAQVGRSHSGNPASGGGTTMATAAATAAAISEARNQLEAAQQSVVKVKIKHI